jgi:glycosyltransferase involved in cell wall biosynthesis
VNSLKTCELFSGGNTGAEYEGLRGKRVGLVVLSAYPFDPRPRRTADALMRHGMSVDYICVADGKVPWHEKTNGIDVFRIPIKHQRGGKLAYAYQYSAFILASATILMAQHWRRRYDLIYINNMPDILVVSALLPKLFGAKVILDLHDPMPELMTAIFAQDPNSKSVRLLKFLEKWSMERADQILTPNVAFKRIFASRSCPQEKIAVIMNSPDGTIFPLRPACSHPALTRDINQPFVVMYHGTLVERNGLQIAVDAFAHIHTKLPTAQLHIYGKTTPFLERVMRTVRERGLQESVLHFGAKPLEQIVDAIDACDVGVVPNQRNDFTEINMPTRIFEYLARGKPVIAPRTAGIRDYFDEHSLLFFEAGDAEDLARTIRFVACNPEEAYRITERGQQVYKAHSWEQEGHALVRVMRELLEPGIANS